jgi:hypothetical protein
MPIQFIIQGKAKILYGRQIILGMRIRTAARPGKLKDRGGPNQFHDNKIIAFVSSSRISPK